MNDTKLSNTDGLDSIIKGVPGVIEEYSKEVHEEVSELQKKSVYYIKFSKLGLIASIAVLILGCISIYYSILFDNMAIRHKYIMYISFRPYFRPVGILCILIGIHLIGRNIFALIVSGVKRKIDKSEDDYKNEFRSQVLEEKISFIKKKIDSREDDELEAESVLQKKQNDYLNSLVKKDKITDKLVLASRIILPIILFIIAINVVVKGKDGFQYPYAVSFAIMLLMCRRLCLLLEYRVGNAIRALMCLPAVIYGIVFYSKTKDLYDGVYFLPMEIINRCPPIAQKLLISSTVVIIAQVLILIWAIFSQDYYSEKLYVSEGLSKKGGVADSYEKPYSLAFIYGEMVIYAGLVFYLLRYMITVWESGELNGEVPFPVSLLKAAIIGVSWRLISSLWPEKAKKAFTKFTGTRYSVMLEFFVIVLYASVFLLEGLVFTKGIVVTCVMTMIVSGIVFALLQMFGRNN